MFKNIHKAQGVIYVILIIAIVCLIALWISKNPSSPLSNISPSSSESAQLTSSDSISPTTTKSIQDIDKSLKELNSESTNIDKGISDQQFDLSI